MEAIGFGALFLVWMAIIVGGIAFWIVAIVEVAKLPEHAFRLAGKEKTTWVLVVALVQWIGALIWWFGPRREVKAAALANPVPPPMPFGPPPGWYPDPAGAPGVAWWDGRQWTGHRQSTPGG